MDDNTNNTNSAQLNDDAMMADNVKHMYETLGPDAISRMLDPENADYMQMDTLGNFSAQHTQSHQQPTPSHRDIQTNVSEAIYSFAVEVVEGQASREYVPSRQHSWDMKFRNIVTVCSVMDSSASFSDLPQTVVHAFEQVLTLIKEYSFILNLGYFDIDVMTTSQIPSWVSTGRSILNFFKSAPLQKVIPLRMQVGVLIETLQPQLLTPHENIELGSNVNQVGRWAIHPDGSLEQSPPLNMLTSADALIERFLMAEFATVNRLNTLNQKVSSWCRNALYRFMLANDIHPIGFGQASAVGPAIVQELPVSHKPVEEPKKSYDAIPGIESVLKPIAPAEAPVVQKSKPKTVPVPKPAAPEPIVVPVEPTSPVQPVAKPEEKKSKTKKQSVLTPIKSTVTSAEEVDLLEIGARPILIGGEKQSKPSTPPSPTKSKPAEPAKAKESKPKEKKSEKKPKEAASRPKDNDVKEETPTAPKVTGVKRPAEPKDGEGPPAKKQKPAPSPPAVQIILCYMIHHVDGCQDAVSLSQFTEFVTRDPLLEPTYRSLVSKPDEMLRRFGNAVRAWGAGNGEQHRYFKACTSDPDGVRYVPDKSTPEHEARWEMLRKTADEKWQKVKPAKKSA